MIKIFGLWLMTNDERQAMTTEANGKGYKQGRACMTTYYQLLIAKQDERVKQLKEHESDLRLKLACANSKATIEKATAEWQALPVFDPQKIQCKTCLSLAHEISIERGSMPVRFDFFDRCFSIRRIAAQLNIKQPPELPPMPVMKCRCLTCKSHWMERIDEVTA